MGFLNANNLVKSYKSRLVVNHVDISVKQGQVIGLLGPNGAGKTTTFQMIIGITRPDEGHIFINDEEITYLPVYKRAKKGVGYLPQEPSIFRKMTVRDNIMSILELQKNMTKKERNERLDNLLNEFSISHLTLQKGYQLSGGERRRVEIARLLVNSPLFLLLDEPFTGVDPIAVAEIQNIIFHLRAKNIGILITDHNVRETLRITDKSYIIYDGKILLSGKPDELVNSNIAREVYLGEKFTL